MLEVTFLAVDVAFALRCAMFATSTVETEPFLHQEFLAFIQGSHMRAIFGYVVCFFAVNACSFTPFTALV